MRPSQKQNRPRGRGGRNKPSGGNIVNRVFESAGPEGKVRGTPQQIIEKYLTLSRDAQTSGDRVMSENFLQHAEHYQRILLDAQGGRDEQRRDQRQEGDERDESDRDDDRDESDRDETGSDEAEEVQASGQRNRRRDDRQDRDDRREGEQRAQQGGGQRGGRSGDERRPEPDRAPQREQQRESEVNGLTTIDSGSDEGGSLLVEDEVTASQPPRRRRNQRRNRAEEPQKTEADAQSE